MTFGKSIKRLFILRTSIYFRIEVLGMNDFSKEMTGATSIPLILTILKDGESHGIYDERHVWQRIRR